MDYCWSRRNILLTQNPKKYAGHITLKRRYSVTVKTFLSFQCFVTSSTMRSDILNYKFRTISTKNPTFMARSVRIPVSNTKCWTCDSIKGPFPVVSAFLNRLLTQIWSLLSPNPDLVCWLATPQNTEWMIYQFLESWRINDLCLCSFLYPNCIYVTASGTFPATSASLLSLLLSVPSPLEVAPVKCNLKLHWKS